MEELAYKNRFVKELVQTLTTYSEADCEGKTPQTISGDDNLVILRVSWEEWRKLYSALYTGADICYPEESDSVRWILQRAVECPVSLCDLIAECIATNPATQDAIRNFVTNDPGLDEWVRDRAAISTVPAGELATNFGNVPDCNPDYLFSVTTAAVDVFNAVSEDLFELVEVGTNALERGEILVSAIPVIGGLLPFDEVLGLADKIVSSFQEAYLEAYTETLEDKLRCDLFCLAKDDCDLTVDRMISYYESELGHSLPADLVEAAQDIADFLWAGTFSGDTIVYAMHLFVLAMIRLAQNVAGINFSQVALRLVAAADEANNDWEILCNDCAPDYERQPIIGSIWDEPNIAGTIEGPTGEGVWTVTAGARGSDQAFAIRDINGRPFIIQDKVYSSGPACQVWLVDDVLPPAHISCGTGDNYTNQVVTEFWTTWPSGTPQTMQFKMVAPPP